MLEQKNVTVKTGSSFQTICPFPIGYIYQSYSSTSPANIYGGSWTPITGRFLYCNSGTSIGGSNTHTLTVNEMPSHIHSMKAFFKYHTNMAGQGWATAVTDWDTRNTNATGGSQPHNNMPAYQTCYAWRRTN